MTTEHAVSPYAISHPTLIRPEDSERIKRQRFLNWLEENGATFPSAQLILENGVRKICAAGRIQAGQLVMHIPQHLMITVAVAKASRIGRLITDSRLDISDHGLIAAFLLQAKRECSFFKPYVDVLPNDVSHLPAFHFNIKPDGLKGSAAERLINACTRILRREHRQLAEHLPSDLQFTEEEYAWAKANVMSRTHALSVDDEEMISMVPLADMLDHARNYNCIWSSSAKTGFSYAAKDAIASDMALTTTYCDTVDNVSLYGYFGFSLEENRNDSTDILLPSLPAEHCAAAAAEKLGTPLGKLRLFKPIARYDHEDTRKMFSFLRLGHMTSTPAPSPASSRPGSYDNELAVLRALASVCHERMAEFSTTMEEDEQLLSTGDLPADLRYVVIVRHGEKRVLKYLLDLAKAGTAFLNGEEPEDGFDGYIDSLRPIAVSTESRHAGSFPQPQDHQCASQI